MTWRKSRRSVNNGACVEVAADPGAVFVRDSADQGGPVLSFRSGSWSEFLTRLS